MKKISNFLLVIVIVFLSIRPALGQDLIGTKIYGPAPGLISTGDELLIASGLASEPDILVIWPETKRIKINDRDISGDFLPIENGILIFGNKGGKIKYLYNMEFGLVRLDTPDSVANISLLLDAKCQGHMLYLLFRTSFLSDIFVSECNTIENTTVTSPLSAGRSFAEKIELSLDSRINGSVISPYSYWLPPSYAFGQRQWSTNIYYRNAHNRYAPIGLSVSPAKYDYDLYKSIEIFTVKGNIFISTRGGVYLLDK